MLVVDDELPIRVLLTRWLKEWGYGARHVGSASRIAVGMAGCRPMRGDASRRGVALSGNCDRGSAGVTGGSGGIASTVRLFCSNGPSTWVSRLMSSWR